MKFRRKHHAASPVSQKQSRACSTSRYLARLASAANATNESGGEGEIPSARSRQARLIRGWLGGAERCCRVSHSAVLLALICAARCSDEVGSKFRECLLLSL